MQEEDFPTYPQALTLMDMMDNSLSYPHTHNGYLSPCAYAVISPSAEELVKDCFSLASSGSTGLDNVTGGTRP